jgi:hypothetical protein
LVQAVALPVSVVKVNFWNPWQNKKEMLQNALVKVLSQMGKSRQEKHTNSILSFEQRKCHCCSQPNAQHHLKVELRVREAEVQWDEVDVERLPSLYLYLHENTVGDRAVHHLKIYRIHLYS